MHRFTPNPRNNLPQNSLVTRRLSTMARYSLHDTSGGNDKMAAPMKRSYEVMEGEMDEMKTMEEEMNRFEQAILTGRNADDDEGPAGHQSPAPPIVPPGIPQALSVLGTPDPSLMNLRFPPPPPPPAATPPERLTIPPSTSPELTTSNQTPVPLPPHLQFLVAPPPAPPGTAPVNIELPGLVQPRPAISEPQGAPILRQETPHRFPHDVQQMPGGAAPIPPRPAFVPHQVRARHPGPPHRPQMYPMHQPRPHRMPQQHPMGRGNFRHPIPGPMGSPMMPHGFPMMPPRPMVQSSPVVIEAKPVKFTQPRKEETSKEMSATKTQETIATTQQLGQVPTATPMRTPVFMQPVMHTQVPMQMYSAATAAAAAQASAPALQQQHQMLQQADHTAASAAGLGESKKEKKKKKFVRTAASTTWEDESLAEWDANDFRIFCGDLGNEVTEDLLTKVFGRYPSFLKAKVVRDKRTSKTKGYGFVSFKDPNDFVQAMREWNGKYVGNRPIKLRKSTWKDRNIDTHRKKQKEKQRLGLR